MKKAVISGYYGFENFGDEISLQVIVNALKDSGVNVTVLSSKPDLTSLDNGVSSFYTFSIFDIVRQIFVSDVLISGGGSLLQDKTSQKSFFYYIFVILVAKMLGKKVIIFSQGLAPLKSKISEMILALVLKQVDYISLRDTESQNYAQKLGAKSKTFSDAVWALGKSNILRHNKLLIQLRQWDKFTDEKIAVLAKLIAEKYKSQKIEILSLQDDKDLEVCQKLYDALQGNVLDVKVLHGLSTNEIVEAIASARSIVAMRYHACLLGLKQGLNIMALSYDEKVTNLVKEFSLPYVYVDEELDLFEMEFKKAIEKFEETRIDPAIARKKEQLAKQSLIELLQNISNIKKVEAAE
ncbi:MAG: polysaccharide pyruvyl transferase CsaB [bacterium]